jgi:hypothetical protein
VDRIHEDLTCPAVPVGEDVAGRRSAPDRHNAHGAGVAAAFIPGGIHIGRGDASLCPDRH